jgi:hypothetical protein
MTDDFPIGVPADHIFEGDLLTIPAAQAAALRSGLCCALREDGDEMCDILASQHREDDDSRRRFSAAFDRMEVARTLLLCDIGWAPPKEGDHEPAEVNLRNHKRTLVAALRAQIEAELGHAESLPEPEREPVHARIGELSGLLAQAEADLPEVGA